MEQTWIWLVVGLTLCAAELLTGTFVILFFGIGALITAAACFAGIQATAPLLAIFAMSSLALLFLFRKKLNRGFSPEEKAKSLSPDMGVKVVLSDIIPAHGESLIEYQGTHWTAVNSGPEDLPKGATVLIEKTEGIKIFVRKLG